MCSKGDKQNRTNIIHIFTRKNIIYIPCRAGRYLIDNRLKNIAISDYIVYKSPAPATPPPETTLPKYTVNTQHVQFGYTLSNDSLQFSWFNLIIEMLKVCC